MKFVIYARTNNGNVSNLSIENQVNACREYAKQQGYTIVEKYCDFTFESKDVMHLELAKLLAASEKQEFEGVLVYSFDRFSRDRYAFIQHKEQLSKNGVILISAAESLCNPALERLAILISQMVEGYDKDFHVSHTAG